MAQRTVFAVLFILAEAMIGGEPLGAQVACNCADLKDFGSCQTGIVDYPGDFPGSAAIVHAKDDAGNDIVYVYVADLYTGLTYRYLLGPNQPITAGTPIFYGISPGGSLTTSGLAYNPADGYLYWAIEDKIYRTDLDLGQVEALGSQNPDLPTLLKDRLGLPVKGSLGGIALHQRRSAGEDRVFWAVDIANNIYFEFVASRDDKTGAWVLALSEENGEPVHFRNPLLSPFGGGAYGTGIAYVIASGRSYFDIPVGALTDGNAARVMRIHADADSEGKFRVGDPTGIFYDIAAAAGPINFITGIVQWPSACIGANNTEILLDYMQPGFGKSRIIQISADDPASTQANLSRFVAIATGNNVKLSWLPTGTYLKLDITRQGLPAGSPVAVASFSNPSQDPLEFVDKNLGDGLYDYIVQVTAPPAPGKKLTALKSRVRVGQGSIATDTIDVTVTASGAVKDSLGLNVTTVDVTYPGLKVLSPGWTFTQGTAFGVIKAIAENGQQSRTLTLDRSISVAIGPAQLRRMRAYKVPANNPFAVTYINSREQLLVADQKNGRAYVFQEKTVASYTKGGTATESAAPESATYTLYQVADANPKAIVPLNQNDKVGFRLSGSPPALKALAGTNEIPLADDSYFWKIDLQFKSTFAGPFIRDIALGGLTTGITYDPQGDKLIWVVQTGNGSFLQRTEVTGALVGSRVPIRVPVNLRRVPLIGDLSYDPLRKEIWGIDRANMVAYSFDSSGVLTGKSGTIQIPAPKAATGGDRDFGGAVSVVESTDTSLVLDFTLGVREGEETPGNLTRLSFNRTGAGGDLTIPGTEVLSADLKSVLLAEEIGGITAFGEGEVDYLYVVGNDTATVYKLLMTSGLRGKEFIRGDVNIDNAINISDGISILLYQFTSKAIKCKDAADLDNSESIDITDAVALFKYLFLNGSEPPKPFPTCGRDFNPPFCEESTCK